MFDLLSSVSFRVHRRSVTFILVPIVLIRAPFVFIGVHLLLVIAVHP